MTMLKQAVAVTLISCCVLGLFVASLVDPDWLRYDYDPANNYDPPYFPKPPSHSAGKLRAKFSLWEGCMDVTWYSTSSWSAATVSKSKKHPEMCYDVLEYNDEYLDFERTRFSLPTEINVTSGVTTPPPTTAPPTTQPNHFITGYVVTALPPVITTEEPLPNTLAAIKCPLPPDVLGATYKIDTPYEYEDISFSRVRYDCENGDYSLLEAPDATLEVFCINGTWRGAPKCTPKDRCLPQAGSWDVCIAGRAWDPPSIVKAIGNELPINSTNTKGFGIFLFPEFEIKCDGIIRQWDIYANVSGPVHLSVWVKLGRRLYFIGKNTVQSSGNGLQGIVIPPSDRIFVRKGYIIGISYNKLLESNNSVVQIYRAADIELANPLLDWKQLLYSTEGIMFNVNQEFVEQTGYIDVFDRRLTSRLIDNGRPVVPMISAYITGAVLRPINYQTVQGLMVLATLGELVSVASLLIFIVLLVKKKHNMLAGPIQSAIFVNLFSCATAINGVVLLIKEYECNSIKASYGTALLIAFAAIGLSAVSVILLCVTDRRLLTEMSRKQFTIVVKPPSAMA